MAEELFHRKVFIEEKTVLESDRTQLAAMHHCTTNFIIRLSHLESSQNHCLIT